MPLPGHLCEWYVRDLNKWIVDSHFGGETVSTAEIATGSYMSDMGDYLLYSGQGDYIMLLTDFSNYDQTQISVMYRASMIRAARRAGAERDMVKYKYIKMKSGEMIDPIELIARYWTRLADAWFEVDGVKYNAHHLFSGEYGTRNINDMVNLAFLDAVREELNKTFFKGEIMAKYIELVKFKVQGDDQISIFRKTPLYLELDISEQREFLDTFTTLLSDVAKGSNLEVSKIKSSVTDYLFEFLKKMGVRGWVIPRYSQLQIFASEKIDRSEDPVEVMRSRIGLLREYIFRGGDMQNSIKLIMLDWTLRRSIKLLPTFEEKQKANKLGKNLPIVIKVLPYNILYAPIDMGGVGMLPWTIVDPNVDEMIRCWDMPLNVRSDINGYYHIWKNIKSHVNLDIFTDALKPALDKGYEFYKRLTSANLGRYNASIAQEKALGITDRAAYYKKDRLEIAQAARANPHSLSYINADKASKYNHIAKELIKMKGVTIPDYLLEKQVFRFIQLEDLKEVISVCPVAGMQKDLKQWFRILGTSNETFAAAESIFKAIKAVVTDPQFPSHLDANRPEAIAKSILEYKLDTIETITAFFIMRGAEAERAGNAAAAIYNNIDKLMFITELNQYSLAGEGFTDKSDYNLSRCVEIGDMSVALSREVNMIMRHVGLQYVRTRDLRCMRMKKVRVLPTVEKLREWYSIQFKNTSRVIYPNLSLESIDY